MSCTLSAANSRLSAWIGCWLRRPSSNSMSPSLPARTIEALRDVTCPRVRVRACERTCACVYVLCVCACVSVSVSVCSACHSHTHSHTHTHHPSSLPLPLVLLTLLMRFSIFIICLASLTRSLSAGKNWSSTSNLGNSSPLPHPCQCTRVRGCVRACVRACVHVC